MKDLGFKTFDKFWSEDYDNLDYKDRIVSIVDTVENIIKDVKIKTDKDNNIVYDDEMKRILEYNYNHYKNVFGRAITKDQYLKTFLDNKTFHSQIAINDKNDIIGHIGISQHPMKGLKEKKIGFRFSTFINEEYRGTGVYQNRRYRLYQGY